MSEQPEDLIRSIRKDLKEIQASLRPRTFLAHDLYSDLDFDAPNSIKDRNGDITLALCKRCGQGEGDLEQDCPGEKK